MKVKKIFIYGLAGLLLSSCAEDFLQRDPLGLENNGTFFDNELGCEQGVNAIYDPLQWLETYSRTYWAIGDVCSDDAEKGGQTESDQADMQELQTFNISTTNPYLSTFWESMYIGIGRANEMLYQTSDGTNFSKDLTLSFRAEAKFLRAFYYFDLMKVFGAVPLVKEPVTPGEGGDIGNRVNESDDGSMQKQVVLDFIISELEEIKDVEILKTEFGRVTNKAIKSLLAKAYIWNKDWANALKYSEEVIAESPDITNVKYQDIFKIDNEQNSEIIFSIQFVNGITQEDYNRGGEGSERSTYQNVRMLKFKYSGESKTEFLGERGYGFNTPTEDLVSKFDKKSDTEYDPRLDMIVSGKDSLWWDFSFTHPKSYPNAKLEKCQIVFPSGQTGYSCRKGALEYDEFSASKQQSSGLDYPLIRLADIYLFAAEAAFNLGEKEKAANYVNKVRERARNSHRKEIGFRQFKSLPPSQYPEDVAAGQLTLDIIYLERRKELFCEGHRFFDLARTGRAANLINRNKEKDGFGVPINFKEGVNEVFPIPLRQISRHTGGNLIQNPGY